MAIEWGHGTHRMAILVFWHVPLRFCNGEALANPRARQAQRMLGALICIAKLSIDLEVLQGARSFEVSRTASHSPHPPGP